jgi:hypothetical protein
MNSKEYNTPKSLVNLILALCLIALTVLAMISINDGNILQNKLMDSALIIACLIFIKAFSNTENLKYEKFN